MKKYIFYIILGFLITTSVSARKTGCEGNCENGIGKWTYTDNTTYEGNWVGTQKHGQGTEIWPNGYIYKGEMLEESGNFSKAVLYYKKALNETNDIDIAATAAYEHASNKLPS